MTKAQIYQEGVIENLRSIDVNISIEKHFDDSITIVKYVRNNKLCALMFAKKKKRSKWNYSFRNEEQRKNHIVEQLESEKFYFLREKEYKEKKAMPHTLKEGDIVYNSWGYDQTNIDYYQVIRTTKKQVILKR
jgi:hypothetical protein